MIGRYLACYVIVILKVHVVILIKHTYVSVLSLMSVTIVVIKMQGQLVLKMKGSSTNFTLFYRRTADPVISLVVPLSVVGRIIVSMV